MEWTEVEHLHFLPLIPTFVTVHANLASLAPSCQWMGLGVNRKKWFRGCCWLSVHFSPFSILWTHSFILVYNISHVLWGEPTSTLTLGWFHLISPFHFQAKVIGSGVSIWLWGTNQDQSQDSCLESYNWSFFSLLLDARIYRSHHSPFATWEKWPKDEVNIWEKHIEKSDRETEQEFLG